MVKRLRKHICKNCGSRFNISYTKIRNKIQVHCPVCKTSADMHSLKDQAVIRGL